MKVEAVGGLWAVGVPVDDEVSASSALRSARLRAAHGRLYELENVGAVD